jgi:formate hydrogenlyase transcriptional activator
MQYSWPGNVRELQNVIERAVILSPGVELCVPAECLESHPAAGDVVPQRTLAEAERDHIVSTLRSTRGVVGGRHGAAARLGVPRTTLLSRMQKLRIVADDVMAARVFA